MPHLAASLFEELGPWQPGASVGLGFSGGADSVFLALAWKAFCARHPALQGVTTQLWVVDHQHHARSGAAAQAAAALAAPAPLAPVPTMGGAWVCTACTFENPNPNALVCDLCNTVRPVAA